MKNDILKKIIAEDSGDNLRKKLEENPRLTAMSPEDIKELYSKFKDKKNIIDEAHPDPVVITDSYDKLMSVIQNNNKKQNVTINILQKTRSGNLLNHKYARQKLMDTLERVSEFLAFKNSPELKVLATVCLDNLEDKKITKKAALPLAVWLIPAALSLVTLQQQMPDFDNGYEPNYKNLIKQIDDVLSSNSNYGLGYDYSPELKSQATKLKSIVNTIHSIYKKHYQKLELLDRPKTGKEVIELSKTPELTDCTEAYKELREAIEEAIPFFDKIRSNFTSKDFKAKNIKEKGFFTDLMDKAQVLHGDNSLVSDDLGDISKALPPYISSLQRLSHMIAETDDLMTKVKDTLTSAITSKPESSDKPKEPTIGLSDVLKGLQEAGEKLK